MGEEIWVVETWEEWVETWEEEWEETWEEETWEVIWVTWEEIWVEIWEEEWVVEWEEIWVEEEWEVGQEDLCEALKAIRVEGKIVPLTVDQREGLWLEDFKINLQLEK